MHIRNRTLLVFWLAVIWGGTVFICMDTWRAHAHKSHISCKVIR